jgi:dTDP-4-amino-4,6-dideoxygalactose transaminase
MSNPYDVIELFEKELCAYTGADFAVAVDSCTNALMLCCEYLKVKTVSIPRYTYASVPQAIKHAGGWVIFDDRKWSGAYSLDPYPIVDSARRLRAGMFADIGLGLHCPSAHYVCTSFHHNKILQGDSGGAILHNDRAADSWFRWARHDGRTDGLNVHEDTFRIIGHRCHMTLGTAAGLRARLAVLPRYNPDLTVTDDHYRDLSEIDWNGIYERQRAR